MSLLSQILPKKEEVDYFLTLAVEEHHIRAAIVEIAGNKVTVLGVGESDFGDATHEIEACDTAISVAEKSLPPEVLVEKTIFALPQSYVENDNVKPEYLAKLKKISKELDLKPSGFIEYGSAISFYLEKEEGSPPTVILLEISKIKLVFSHVRIGKVVQNITVPKTDSVIDDFSDTLSQFETDVLPARIILYDNTEKLEDIREELLRFPWHKHSIFQHTPKIEIFPSIKIMQALVEAAGTSFLSKDDTSSGEKEVIKTENKEDERLKSEIEDISDLKDEDTHHESHKKIKEVESSEEFGFTKKGLEEIKKKPQIDENINIEVPLSVKGKNDFGKYRQKIGKVFTTLIGKIPDVTTNFEKGSNLLKNRILVFIGFPVIVFAVLVISLWIKYPQANVYLYIYPQIQSKSIDVKFTRDSGSPSANSIPVSDISEEISGEKNKVTSGKSNVGERAKGEIIIYNKTLSGKTFPKGTQLTTNSLKFSLDDETNVASASDTGEGLSFGKTSAKITALAIGLEGNITGGNTFIFKDFPETSFTAKNNQALSGGTSREVQSISKEDQKDLEDSLTKELINKVKQKLLQKITSGETLIDSSIKTEVITKKFSGEVGAEANEVKLNLSLKISGLVYKNSDLLALSKNFEMANLPQMKLDENRTDARVEAVGKESKSSIDAKVKLNYYFIPDLDTAKIKNSITGKNYDQVSSYLQTMEKIAGFKISMVRKLPFIPKKMPASAQNINLYIVTR